jgi:hypothetical protein
MLNEGYPNETNRRVLVYNIQAPRFNNLATNSGNTGHLAFFRMDLPDPVIPVVATPVLTPSTTQPFRNPFTLNITCETEDADIYYTTDGSDPSLPGAIPYTAPINITDATTTIRAIAKKIGMDDSDKAEATYEIATAPPTLSVNGGVYNSPQTITLTTATNGATIYYTLENETPTTPYTTPIPITENTTIRTIAVHSTYGPSSETSATYYITSTYEGTFSRITTMEDLETGYYIFAHQTFTSQNTVHQNNYFQITDVTLHNGDNDIINPTSHIVWLIEELTGDDSGKYTFLSLTTNQYAAFLTGGGNNVYLHNTANTNQEKWTIAPDGNVFTILNAQTTDRLLKYNTNNTQERFACYTTTTNLVKPALYKLHVPVPVAIPEFEFAEGPHHNPFNIQITTATANALIYYTTDGSEPTTESNPYGDGIEINLATTQIRAFAVKENYLPSEIIDETFTITTANPTFSQAQGTYNEIIELELFCETLSAEIYYKLNDGEFELYETGTPIEIAETTTVTIYATHCIYGDSEEIQRTFTINLTQVATPQFSHTAGTHHNPFELEITCTTDDVLIFYIIDENEPQLYTNPITIDAPTTSIIAFATKTDYITSEDNEAVFEISTATPTFLLPEGGYATFLTIGLECITQGALIYYSLNEDAPETPYTEAIAIQETTTITIKAVHEIYGESPTATATYTINLPQVAQPSFTPSTTAPHHNAFTLTIASTTENTTIYFTTDGSFPTTSSQLYEEPITINSDTTRVRAIAIKAEYIDSIERDQIFTINTALPTLSVSGGVFSTPQSLTITTATNNADIYVSINNEDEFLYTDPLQITENTTIVVYATHEIFGPTSNVTATYLFTTTYEGTFSRITSIEDLETGYYVLASTTNAMQNTNPGTLFNRTIVTLHNEDDDIIDPTSHIVWYIEKLSENEDIYTFQSLTTGQYAAYRTGNTQNLIFLNDEVVDNQTKWEVSFSDEFDLFEIENQEVLGRVLGYNPLANGLIFRTYGSYNPNALRLDIFKLTDPTPPDQVATPVFTPSATAPHHNPFTLAITSTTEDAEIYYTTDGTDPSLETATLYTTPINIIAHSTQVRAIAKKVGMLDSEEREMTYNITIATPTFSIAAGTYTTILSLELTCETVGAVIYYRMAGQTTAEIYVEPIIIAETTTVTIFASHFVYGGSPEISAEYIINLPQLAPPIFTPPAGSYQGQVVVSIAPNPENEGIDVELRYTTDGSEPTIYSTHYTGSITVTTDTLIRARFFATGYIASEIASAMYEITTSIQDPEVDIPMVTQISRVYPNPVAASMDANFDVKVRLNETATVKIYNLKGQLVKEFKPLYSGVHKLSWNRRDNNNNEVASGVYLYQIISPTTNTIQKMLIIK